jgi:hypothetical protein
VQKWDFSFEQKVSKNMIKKFFFAFLIFTAGEKHSLWDGTDLHMRDILFEMEGRIIDDVLFIYFMSRGMLYLQGRWWLRSTLPLLNPMNFTNGEAQH